MFSLANGFATYSVAEAFETICEYAFGTVQITPDPHFPSAFAPHEVPRFAYRAYDCILPTAGPQFSSLDLFVTAGLNARVDMKTVVRLRSFADRAAGHLDAAHQLQTDFLRLCRREISNEPPAGTAGWHLAKAWLQGMATRGLGVARVHKMLHHKRPHLVPLLDNRTVRPLEAAAQAMNGNQWQVIYDEIHAQVEQFEDLAERFNRLAAENDGVPLSLLRLYDILLWMKAGKASIR